MQLLPLRIKISIILFFILTAMGPSYGQSDERQTHPNPYPDLLYSIRFEKQITFCGKIVPVEKHSVKQRLEKEMLLALWDRPQVILWLKRSKRYFNHIEAILTEHHLPEDYKYIPVVESALRPHAGSSKGAVGWWQFLRSTGRRHGLKINRRIDERKNLFRSTEAAASYLSLLKEQFGSDILAVAAYNMGGYALKQEIEAQENKDFFSLYLPLETQRYIFKLIAVKLIIENPERYGFYLTAEDLYPTFSFDKANIKTDREIPIVLIANAAETSFKQIKDMNPEIRGYYLSKGRHTILIPKGSAAGFKDKFQTFYKKYRSKYHQRFHIVKKGENLSLIASKYDLSLGELLKLNHFSIKKMIHPGDRLIVE